MEVVELKQDKQSQQSTDECIQLLEQCLEQVRERGAINLALVVMLGDGQLGSHSANMRAPYSIRGLLDEMAGKMSIPDE